MLYLFLNYSYIFYINVAISIFSLRYFKVAFSEDGSYFVTAGFRHVKFWFVDTIGVTKPNEKGAKIPGQTSVIEGRAGILGMYSLF